MNQPSTTDQGDKTVDCLAILGLMTPVTEEDVKAAYLEKVKTAHPDHGGDAREFVKLQEAFQQATEYARFKTGRLQWLSQRVEQYAEQQQIVKEVEALGGKAELEGVDWVTRTIGIDFATVLDRIAGLELTGPNINDEVLSHFATRRVLVGLRRLNLANSKITSFGLALLHSCVALRELNLSGTGVDSDDVKLLLEHLPDLASVGLENTNISWVSRKWLRMTNRGLKIT